MNPRKIAVVGLGYVGLPVALAVARKFPKTIGFDISQERVNALRAGVDSTNEIDQKSLKEVPIIFTADPQELRSVDFFIVAVPTPIDKEKRPDLSCLVSASEMIGRVMSAGAIVVYESTVYPGLTEEVCGPVLSRSSGLTQGVDFKLGYSPERINPGDKQHTLEKVVKVVSAEDRETLEIVANVYATVVEVGVYRASSIKVAEAAKVIENTQRDLNIALINELAIIFDKLGISTSEVLDAAATKWNFLRFNPGLVGGHCIGVDPYYLTSKAEQLGYHPQVILSGRRINDSMGQYVAQRTVKLMVSAGIHIKNSKVGILGITFKENISDTRNSRVPSIVHELAEFGISPLIHDPLASAKEVFHEYGLNLSDWNSFKELDAIIVAVNHQSYMSMARSDIFKLLRSGGVFVDVKSSFPRDELTAAGLLYWQL